MNMSYLPFIIDQTSCAAGEDVTKREQVFQQRPQGKIFLYSCIWLISLF